MYEIVTFSGFLILVFLGLNLVYRSQGKSINLIVGIWLFSASIWALGQTFMYRATDFDSVLWSIGLAHLGVFILSSTTLHFALSYPSKRKITYNRFMLLLIYLLPVIFYLVFLTVDRNFAIVGYLSFFMVYFFVASGLILFTYSTLKTEGIKRKGSALLTLGVLVGLFSSVLYELGVIPSTTLFPISGVLFSYAIIKYKLVDITPCNAAEKIIDTMADCLVLTDENNRIKRVNKSFKTILGFRDSFVIGKEINSFFKADLFEDLNEGKIIRNYQDVVQNKNEDTLNVSVNASSIRDQDSKIAGFIYTFTDITDQKKSEEKLKDRTMQVERLLKQKDEFIHLLAHDLKSPLTPLNAFLPMIRKRVKDEKSSELIDIAIKNVSTINKLIDDALELARLEAVETEVDFQEIDLDSIIDRTIGENQMFLEKNKFLVEKNIDKEIHFYGNEFQIKEVFNNIISNAVKYTPEDKEGLLLITAYVEDDFVKVSISDNGRGLSLEEKERVFDKFYKYGKSRSGMQSTGLGLSLCKNIIDKHGGKIWVESDGKGKGSTFSFLIPIPL